MTQHTLASAAKAIGKARSTVLRAVQSGRISAEKDSDGVWRIDPAELHRVYPAIAPDMATDPSDEHIRTQGLDSNFNAHRAELDALKQQIRDLRDDRDQWRTQAQTLLLAHAPKPPDSRPWWRRLFG